MPYDFMIGYELKITVNIHMLLIFQECSGEPCYSTELWFTYLQDCLTFEAVLQIQIVYCAVLQSLSILYSPPQEVINCIRPSLCNGTRNCTYFSTAVCLAESKKILQNFSSLPLKFSSRFYCSHKLCDLPVRTQPDFVKWQSEFYTFHSRNQVLKISRIHFKAIFQNFHCIRIVIQLFPSVYK